jgi:hypothetical protein
LPQGGVGWEGVVWAWPGGWAADGWLEEVV